MASEADSLLPFNAEASTPSAIGEAVSAKVSEERQASVDKAYRDQFDLVDPSESASSAESARPEKAEAARTPAEPVFAPDLLRRASDAGLTIEEAKAFGKPELLERTLAVSDRRVAALANRQPVPEYRQPPPPPPELPPPPRLDPEVFTPELIAAFDAQQKHYQAAIEVGQRKYEQQLAHFHNVQTTQEATTAADAFFAKCDPETFGEGSGHNLDPHSDAMGARRAVYQKHLILEAGYKAVSGRAPSRAALLEEAHHAIYGKQISEKATQDVEKSIAQKLRTAEGQFISKPSRSGSAKPQEGADFAFAEMKRHPFFTK